MGIVYGGALLEPLKKEDGAVITGNDNGAQAHQSLDQDTSGAITKRERSTIGFPYGDLNDATGVARAVHDNAGTKCTIDQLAGWMGQTTSSGAFRGRVATARIFGLIESARGEISLSALGIKVVDPNQERRAKVGAYLHVPLYKSIYEAFRGRMLPPPAALEREMVNLGVSSKQKDKARQAFERSAAQAGFFEHGKERLIMPAGLGDAEPPPENGHKPLDHNGGGGGGGGGPDLSELHPFIQGLLKTLPEPDSEWSVADRAKWLRTAANVFGLIYKGEGNITIGE